MIGRFPQARAASDVGDVRAHNLLLVLHAIADHGPIARTAIAELTGLSKASITGLTADLSARGLIRSADDAPSRGPVRGRPLERLTVDGSGAAVMAVQLRFEDIVVEAQDLGGVRRHRKVVKHGRPMGDPTAMARKIAQGLDAAWKGLDQESVDVRLICLVVAAPVAGRPTLVPQAIDFGWREPVDLVGLVRTELAALGRGPVDVLLENDASMAGIAERDALDPKPSTMVYLKSNTGIGGAAFVDGKLLRGASGMAFEPGHVVVVPGGIPCDCGQRGCLVTVAGPEVIVAHAGLTAVADERGLSAALRELIRRWREGEPEALGAIDELLKWFAHMVTVVRAFFDPERIVIGGYWTALSAALRKRLADGWPNIDGKDSAWADRVVHSARFSADATMTGSLLDARWNACERAVRS